MDNKTVKKSAKRNAQKQNGDRGFRKRSSEMVTRGHNERKSLPKQGKDLPVRNLPAIASFKHFLFQIIIRKV